MGMIYPAYNAVSYSNQQYLLRFTIVFHLLTTNLPQISFLLSFWKSVLMFWGLVIMSIINPLLSDLFAHSTVHPFSMKLSLT